MSTEWFVMRNNAATGPYTAAALKAFVAAGKIRETDLIRKGRDGKPVPASSVKGLFPRESSVATGSGDLRLSPGSSDPTVEWYYGKDGNRCGPVTWSQLRGLADARQLLPSDLVWREGRADWVPAAKIEGLFALVETTVTAAKSPPPITSRERRRQERDGASERTDLSEPFFIPAQAQGLGRILPSGVLSKLSKAGYAIGLTILVLFLLLVVHNGPFTTAVAFGLAVLVYWDTSANKVGLVRPRGWFTTNLSAGMWATMTLLLWPLIVPSYLINRPRLVQKAQDHPREPGARNVKLGILGALAALFLLASFGPPNSRPGNAAGHRQNADRQLMSAPKAHDDRQVPVISWSEIEQTYGLHSKTTDVQKEHLWNEKYKGKRIRWQGAVRNFRKGLLYGGTLDIRMDRDTMTHDVEVNLDQSVEVDKASKYSKDALVTFEGTLANYGVSFLDIIVVDDGVITDHVQP